MREQSDCCFWSWHVRCLILHPFLKDQKVIISDSLVVFSIRCPFPTACWTWLRHYLGSWSSVDTSMERLEFLKSSLTLRFYHHRSSSCEIRVTPLPSLPLLSLIPPRMLFLFVLVAPQKTMSIVFQTKHRISGCNPRDSARTTLNLWPQSILELSHRFVVFSVWISCVLL